MKRIVLSVGELLWDVLPDKTLLGGAPSNLAFRLVEMGEDCRIVSRVGMDDLGAEALRQVSSLGLSLEFIQEDPDHKTGTVDVTFDADRNPDYVINTNAAYDYIEPTPELLDAAGACSCLVFGTLAQRTPVTRSTIADLIGYAGKAKKFLDINLRKDCYSKEVVDHSLRNADVLKTNHHEIMELREMMGLSATLLPELTEELSGEFGISTTVVTMEEFGVFLFDREEGKHYLPGYNIALEDPLGSGDAFSAAFIYYMLEGASLKEACIRGNMLGASVATTKGGTQPVDPDFIREVIRTDQLHIEKSLSGFIPDEFREIHP
jgi:fructokinase